VDVIASSEAKRFPNGCVASPHHLASSTGLAVLADGGNAVDAAVAANLTLGVVAPYLCGYGGDLFAIVWRPGDRDGGGDGDGDATGLWAYNGSGRAPAAATREAVEAAAGSTTLPSDGPLTVTVPGAVDGWFTLLERFGTRSFGDLSRQAAAYAEEGFVLSRQGAASIERTKHRFGPPAAAWWAVYGDATAGATLRQPALARTIRTLADDGPSAYYGGAIGTAIAGALHDAGGFMAAADLADHTGDAVEPMRMRYRDVEVVELPPNSQGPAALQAMAIAEAFAPNGLPSADDERQHVLIEATKLALEDRDAFLTDPDHMTVATDAMLDPARVSDRSALIRADRARAPEPGRPVGGGTAYICAADRDGMLVSLIQSNYMGFGSGVAVPDWGINLHNRGAYFSLDPGHPNVIAPRKRTLHTLIPAMAFRDGRPWMVFGTMGGDGQAQFHLQLMVRMVDDQMDPQQAIGAPRWLLSPGDWSVLLDERFAGAVQDGLAARGHATATASWDDGSFGHAHAIEVTPHGYRGATEPRTEGAVLGL
jgi:gamma-glutamyltranspeptidase/glutathione hydrolase